MHCCHCHMRTSCCSESFKHCCQGSYSGFSSGSGCSNMYGNYSNCMYSAPQHIPQSICQPSNSLSVCTGPQGGMQISAGPMTISSNTNGGLSLSFNQAAPQEPQTGQQPQQQGGLTLNMGANGLSLSL